MSDDSIKLIIPEVIVGLGNPEPKYDLTRHNIGFQAIDLLADRWNITLKQEKKFKGMFGEGKDKIKLLKPLTYMNLSGESIQSVTGWYKLSPESVLVIYDDMDLPIGKMRLRLSGSAGGHNGMKSIIANLGSQNFPRLRLGIGKPKHSGQPSNSHVLGRFTDEEWLILKPLLELMVEAIELSLVKGVEKAMSLYNNKSISLGDLNG